MKTPRQILLEQHRAVEPQLNRVRTRILAGIAKAPSLPGAKPSRTPWPLRWLEELWLGLVWPARRIWVGFAVVWLAIVLVNLSVADHSGTREARARTQPGETLLTWEQQEKLLAELTGPSETPAADKTKPARPQPRSERQTQWLMA